MASSPPRSRSSPTSESQVILPLLSHRPDSYLRHISASPNYLSRMSSPRHTSVPTPGFQTKAHWTPINKIRQSVPSTFLATPFKYDGDMKTEKPISYGQLAFQVKPQQPSQNDAPHGVTRFDKRGIKRKLSGSEISQDRSRRLKMNSVRVGSKSIKTVVPMDIWAIILSFSEPRTLLQIKSKPINQAFQELLSYESLFRTCRYNSFGMDVPDPPTGVTEAEYLELLDGGPGCMACNYPNARKTYWAFYRRWCENCFKKLTVSDDSTFTMALPSSDLLDCLACATIDAWSGYEFAGRDQTNPLQNNIRHVIYCRDSVTKIIDEFGEFLDSKGTKAALPWDDATKAAVEQWKQEKKHDVEARIATARKLERWEREKRHKNRAQNNDFKTEREKFFKQKASEMNPPLAAAALELTKAYQMAIKIARPATERAWTMLKPKLVLERTDAEQMLRFDRLTKDGRLWKHCRDIRFERFKGASKEEVFILQLARTVIADIDRSGASRSIDEGRYCLYALQQTWNAYNALPANDRPIASYHTWANKLGHQHKLTLADALAVYKTILIPRLEARAIEQTGMHPGRIQPFRCPACTRKDVRSIFTLHDLYCHLYKRHASQTGSLSCFRQAGPDEESLFWFNIAWSRNLPAIPKEEKPTGTWDPNERRNYSLPSM